jgi:DUF4097 and DUF4098 domain-containing protein YvlB
MIREQARAQREMFRAQRDAYRLQYRGMRRGSIVGPLLVITIGIVFLLVQTGKIASVRLWYFYDHWWPVLLIAVGVIVLIEWGIDQALHTDDSLPYVRRRVGGGVVSLLILMTVLGFVSEGIHGNGGTNFFDHSFNLDQEDIDQFMGDKHESDQALAQAFPAEGSLQVTNPRGDVTITGTSDDNQIHVILHKEIYSRSDDDAASKAQQMTSDLHVNGNEMQLVLPAIEGARVDLIITVPAIAANSVMANHGDVHVSGVKGPVNVTANHGDVELSAITGVVRTRIQNSGSDFSAHSVTGPVSLEGKAKDVTISDISGNVSMQGDFFGDTHLDHIRGSFKFKSSRTDFQLARLDGEASFSDDDLSAEQAVGPVFLSTRNRNIKLDRIAGDVTVTNKNGKVEITSAPPLGNVSVENRNGEVSVTLPDEAGFNLHADTTDADIQNDFSLPVVDQNNHKSITGTVGKGSSTINISTTQDDIAVRRANIAALPPLPPTPPVITVMPAEAQQAVKDARAAAKDAARQAKEAAEDARKAAKDAASQH